MFNLCEKCEKNVSRYKASQKAKVIARHEKIETEFVIIC